MYEQSFLQSGTLGFMKVTASSISSLQSFSSGDSDLHRLFATVEYLKFDTSSFFSLVCHDKHPLSACDGHYLHTNWHTSLQWGVQHKLVGLVPMSSSHWLKC